MSILLQLRYFVIKTRMRKCFENVMYLQTFLQCLFYQLWFALIYWKTYRSYYSILTKNVDSYILMYYCRNPTIT
jgi:hypothetical protein